MIQFNSVLSILYTYSVLEILMSIHDSSPLNIPSQDYVLPHWVRDFFCLSSNGSLYGHPLIASDPSSSPPWLPAYHLSSGLRPYPMICPAGMRSTGRHRMTGGSWRGLSPLLGQIRHNDRRQREPALIPFHVPWGKYRTRLDRLSHLARRWYHPKSVVHSGVHPALSGLDCICHSILDPR